MDKFNHRVAANSKAQLVLTTREMIDMHRAGYVKLAALLELGDKLSAELAGGAPTLLELISKWAQHHYRPTLRGDIGPREIALADLYDYVAKFLGVDVEAYRG